MSVFLMAFMMKASLSESPRDFIVYCLVRYALMGIFAVALIPLFKKHPLWAWRSSMAFSILQITTIILFSSWPGFIYVTALFSALESILYWRPKIIFDTLEVSDQNRVNFKSTGQILIEAAKIIMPIVLGFAIQGSGYQNAAIFILVISILQLILSLFFRPRQHRHSEKRNIFRSVQNLFEHESLQRLIWLQLLRGLLTASAAYVVVATIALNLSAADDIQRGFITALGSIFAIIALVIYRKFAHNRRAQKVMLVSLAPAVILVPLVAFFFPNDSLIGIIFYIFTAAVVASLLDSTIGVVRIQDILSRHAKNDDDRVVIEAIGESFLSIGRAISLGILLLVVCFADYRYELLFTFMTAFLVLPLIAIAIPSGSKKLEK